MISPRSCKSVANQFLITDSTEGVTYFQSYKATIAAIHHNGDVELDEKYWNWSRTTSKYRSEFLGESTEVTRKKINDGTYKLVNLNF